ncbi:uncharacterized protein LOC123864746 [Maniola jurtina]|uniref:uncharacterized protein LOC123864746 n=1 Tax=Maniola jurtina TaxID=191418 RepID=UPI001E68CFC9|nr:uncharacterized protein LOC123864746 [Maniola jurtina]
MNLINLPPEIWITVINYLDTKSKLNLYNTSLKVRGFFVPINFKNISLSRSTLATIRSLKLDLFLDVAKHVHELNLSGVPDITPAALEPCMKNFKNLITLDVTFTSICLSDLGKICPKTLRNIHINFFKRPKTCYVEFREKWDCAKQVFTEQQFINVHFIVFHFMSSFFPLLFLNELPRIEYLKVDVMDAHKYYLEGEYYPEKLTNINFSRLRYSFYNCHAALKQQLQIDFEKVEYICMTYSKKIVIYVSPIFKHLFPNNSILTVKVKNILPSSVIQENAIFHAWNKSTTTFDEKLFKSILEDYKDCFPMYICMHNILRRDKINVSTNWYCLDESNSFEKIVKYNAKKVTCTDKMTIPTLIKFDEWDRIRNITFLRISNLYFGEDSILLLFSNCKRIVTLDIYNYYNPTNSSLDYMTPLSKAMEHL